MPEELVIPPGMTMAEARREIILTRFEHYEKNKTATANSLGITVRSLDAWLEKYGKDDSEVRTQTDKARLDREYFLYLQRGEVQHAPEGHTIIVKPLSKEEWLKRRNGEMAAPTPSTAKGPVLKPNQVKVVR